MSRRKHVYSALAALKSSSTTNQRKHHQNRYSLYIICFYSTLNCMYCNGLVDECKVGILCLNAFGLEGEINITRFLRRDNQDQCAVGKTKQDKQVRLSVNQKDWIK